MSSLVHLLAVVCTKRKPRDREREGKIGERDRANSLHSATSNTTGSLVAAIPYSAAATVNTANKAVYLRLLGKMLETIFVAPVVWVARFLYTFY